MAVSQAPLRPLSLSYYTVPELSPPDMVDVAADAGCRHVGMRLLNGGPSEPTSLMSDPQLRRVTMQRLRERGLTALDASGARLRPDSKVSDFAPLLDVAAELGVRHMLATGDDPEFNRLLDNIAALCQMARTRSLRIEIEFVPWLSIASLRDAQRLVAETGSDNLGIAVDALHFDRSRSSLEDLAAVPRDYLRYAHFCDAPRCTDYSREDQIRVATRERLSPGEGELDLVGLIRALPHGIPLTLEIPMAELARSLPALERVNRAVAATRAVLAVAESAT